MNVAIVVQGLFEKSDFIGYDAIFQWKTLTKLLPDETVLLFAERFDSLLHPGIAIGPISDFFELLAARSDFLVVYHYCDGWPEIDNFLQKHPERFVIRWHNNTPPWFYGRNDMRSAERSLRGYEIIRTFFECENARFWANSEFSAAQLAILGAHSKRVASVFPAS